MQQAQWWATKLIKGLRYMVYMKRLSLFSFKKQRLLAAYSYLRGEYREDGSRVFLNTLWQDRRKHTWKKNFITVRMVRHWHRCQKGCGISIFGDAHNSPGHGPEQPHLIGSASSSEMDQIISEVPSKPNYSVTLFKEQISSHLGLDMTKYTMAYGMLKK